MDYSSSNGSIEVAMVIAADIDILSEQIHPTSCK